MSKNPNRYPGSYSPNPQNGASPWPWLPPLLAHLGRQEVYDQLSPGLNQASDQIRISTLVCSSRSDVPSGAAMSYVANMGRSDAYGTSPNFYDLAGNGVFHNHWPAAGRQIVRIDQVFVMNNDGTTQTILTSENLDTQRWTDLNAEYEQGLLWISNDSSGNPLYPPSPYPLPGLNRDAGNTPIADINHARPSSYHPGGFVVSFCDESVKFFRDEIDYTVYIRLMTPAGLQAVPPNPKVITPQELNP